MRVMRSVSLALISLMLFVTPVSASQSTPEVTSSDLVERAAEWDGERVCFTGEAIGGPMSRGASTWVHLNDDAYALDPNASARTDGYNSGQAVLAPTVEASRIEHYGAYRQRGDIVRIEGVFHAADSRYGGDMLIEAQTLTIVRRGETIPDPVPGWKLTTLLVLALTTGLSYLALRLQTEAKRPTRASPS